MFLFKVFGCKKDTIEIPSLPYPKAKHVAKKSDLTTGLKSSTRFTNQQVYIYDELVANYHPGDGVTDHALMCCPNSMFFMIRHNYNKDIALLESH